MFDVLIKALGFVIVIVIGFLLKKHTKKLIIR